MINKTIIHPFATEAANPDTPAERLIALSNEHALLPILAANHATPSTTLELLGKKQSPIIRRPLAQNPNTPTPLLLQLAPEFPGEFLANPVLPLLNLSQPDFIKKIPPQAWHHLLRYETIPASWLKLLQQDFIHFYGTEKQKILETIQSHILVAGELTGTTEISTQTAIDLYKKSINRYSQTPMYTFLPFLLTIPMLANELVSMLKSADTIQKRLILESYPKLSGEVLSELAHENDAGILCRIARQPHTSPYMLHQLSANTEPSVRRAVACNPYTAPSLLHQLAGDEAVPVRRAVAYHRNTSLEDLETLAHDPEVPVRSAVALHSQLDTNLAALLANDTSSKVRCALARNVHIPQHIFTALTYDRDFTVRCEAAHNPRLPKDLYSVLLHDKIDAVRYNLAKNAQLPSHMFVQLYNDPGPLMHEYLALNPRVSPSSLMTLMQNNTMNVWRNIAHNPHTSPAMLTYLAHNGNAEVRAAVASNKRTPIAILHEITNHPEHRSLTTAQLSNPHTPFDILEDTLSTGSLYYYFRAANHPIIRQEHRSSIFNKFLTTIKRETVPSQLRLSLLQRTEIPLSMLHAFANSTLIAERYLVVLHPKTPRSLLETLTHDGDRSVRALARTMLAKRDNHSKEAL